MRPLGSKAGHHLPLQAVAGLAAVGRRAADRAAYAGPACDAGGFPGLTGKLHEFFVAGTLAAEQALEDLFGLLPEHRVTEVA